jgi:hypothetical protein
MLILLLLDNSDRSCIRDTDRIAKSSSLPIVSRKEMKSTTLSASAHSTSIIAKHSKPLSLTEMLDEIQQSKRKLLSQPSPFPLLTRSPSVRATASNAETAQASLCATYNVIAAPQRGAKPANPVFPTDVARLPQKS